MNEKKAIKICNWVNDNVSNVSPILLLFLIFFGFGVIFLYDSFGYFSTIPFVILTLFIFISFFVEYRLKKNFNLEYDYLNYTYGIKSKLPSNKLGGFHHS